MPVAARVLNRWEAKCASCPRVVVWETVQTDVAGTRAVTLSRCPSCNRQK